MKTPWVLWTSATLCVGTLLNWLLVAVAVWPWMLPPPVVSFLAVAPSTPPNGTAPSHRPVALQLLPSSMQPYDEVPWFAVTCAGVAVALSLVGIAVRVVVRRHPHSPWPSRVVACAACALAITPWLLPTHLTGVLQSSVASCSRLPCRPASRGVQGDITRISEVSVRHNDDVVHVSIGSFGEYPWCATFPTTSVTLHGVTLRQTHAGGTQGQSCEPAQWEGEIGWWEKPVRLVAQKDGSQAEWWVDQL